MEMKSNSSAATTPTPSALYDVTVSYSEPGSAKTLVLGSLICPATGEEDASAQAKSELWGEPFDTNGRTPHFDCRVLPRYLACPGWSHIFDAGKQETTRWTIDRVTSELIDADVQRGQTGDEWESLGKVDRADLMESLVANEVEANPSDFDVNEVDDLPAWSTRAVPPEERVNGKMGEPGAALLSPSPKPRKPGP